MINKIIILTIYFMIAICFLCISCANDRRLIKFYRSVGEDDIAENIANASLIANIYYVIAMIAYAIALGILLD